MTKEIELLKQEIKMMQSKLALLEEMEKQPRMYLENEGDFQIVSFNGKIFYRTETPTVPIWWEVSCGSSNERVLNQVCDKETQEHLEFNYNNQIKSKPTKEVLDSLEDKYEKYGGISYFTDDVIDKIIEKHKSKKLWNRVRNELGYSVDCVNEIVDLVEDWILDEQSAAGSQNVNTELLVEGFNDAIQKMKEMLR